MKLFPVVLALTVALPAAAQTQASRNMINGPSGSLELRSPPFIRPLALPVGAIGATINLSINDPQNVDIDLDVYERNPEADSSAVPLCSSYDEGAFETCRALPKSRRDTLWVRVFVAGGERGGSGFRLAYAPVYGNRIEGTSLTTAEARRLTLNQTYVGVFRSTDESSDALRQLFRVDAASQPLGDQVFVTLVPTARGDFVRLQVFDSAGALVSAARSASESQQLTVNGAARHAPLYVLAELARRGRATQYVSGSGFRLRVSQQAQNIPVALGPQLFRDDGSGERTYEVSVPAGSAASLTLEGSSYQLVLADGDPKLVEADTAALGPRTSLRIGAPWNNSRILRLPLYFNQTFRIRVAPRREATTYGGGTWTVTMRAMAPDIRGYPALLSFSSDSAIVWDASSPTLSTTKTMPVGRTGVAVALLPSPTSVDVRQQMPSSLARPPVSGSRMTARLSPRDAEEFDLVVCDDSGGILDIGESSASWQWTPDRQAVFIIAIPDPSRFASGFAPHLVGRNVSVGLYGGGAFIK